MILIGDDMCDELPMICGLTWIRMYFERVLSGKSSTF